MNNIASIALSGMNAASLSLVSAAHNVANVHTPGFRRQLAVPQTQPEGGVAVNLERAAVAGAALTEDVVQQMSAAYSFKANLLTLQTHDRMLGSLLDLKA